MGFWGVGPFDNDEAADWVISLLNSDDLSELDLKSDIRECMFEDVFPENYNIFAKSEVIWGLCKPDQFIERYKSGPRSMDPLRDFVSGTWDSKELRSFDEDTKQVVFGIPGTVAHWVDTHRSLDAKKHLSDVETLLDCIASIEQDEEFGAFESLERLRYFEDLRRRVKLALYGERKWL